MTTQPSTPDRPANPIDLAARDLSHDEALQHRDDEALERWTAEVLGREPTTHELMRAGIMLDCRIQRTGALEAEVYHHPDRHEPVAVPCPRCRMERPCIWDGWHQPKGMWRKPPPCDGVECGFLGLADPIVPTVRAFEQLIARKRDEVWAFRFSDPQFARERAEELGALLLFARTLELVALGGEDAPELARAALALEADVLAPRVLTARPEFDLADVPNEDDESGPYPELVEPDPGPGPAFVVGPPARKKRGGSS